MLFLYKAVHRENSSIFRNLNKKVQHLNKTLMFNHTPVTGQRWPVPSIHSAVHYITTVYVFDLNPKDKCSIGSIICKDTL
jgi:hypothetical protein